MDSLDLDFSWSKGGFDNIMMVDFTFTNTSSRAVKDLTIRCTHSAPSGTIIDDNVRTIYEIVPAKGKKRVRDFNMGFIHTQAKSSSCAIENFKFAN